MQGTSTNLIQRDKQNFNQVAKNEKEILQISTKIITRNLIDFKLKAIMNKVMKHNANK